MAACTIYQTKGNEFKIVSQCETKAGFLLDTPPVFILPVTCSDEALHEAVLLALKNSKRKVKTPERDEFPVFSKNVLSELNEKSYHHLYKHASSCSIRAEHNSLQLYPNKAVYYDGGSKLGLERVKEEMITLENYSAHPDQLAGKVRALLSGTCA